MASQHARALRTAPVGSRAGKGFLPVSPGIAALLPEAGIRRGAVVAIEGSTSLALALAAEASRDGGWCAAVGSVSLGFLAPAELGIDLARFAVVQTRGLLEWARATNALLDGCDLVLGWIPASLQLKQAERLIAVSRERGAVLVPVGSGWPGRVDMLLSVTHTEWMGLGRGSGRLRARRVEVAVSGRGAASMVRRSLLWLPDANGEVTFAVNDEPLLDETRVAK